MAFKVRASMPGAASTPKFFNPEIPPSPGGWHFWLDAETRLYPIRGNSAGEVFDRLKRYQENNRKFTGDDAIWAQLWKYWCSLEPKRCGDQGRKTAGTMPPREIWGPILWRMLNWAAVNYSGRFFNALILE